jgi:dienelactone hydrolase
MTRHLKFMAGLMLAAFVTSTAQAAIKTERVTYRDGDVELQGYLTWDDAVAGKRPGILVAHEWWGLNDYVRRRAQMLAKLGYVAFAADMYGKGKVTQHGNEAKAWMEQISANADAWRRRGLAGLEILRKHPKVDASRLGAMGYCFGGATVMQLAYAGADLKGVVSFHGSLPVPTEAEGKTIKARVLAAHGAADAYVPPERVLQFQNALEQAGADWSLITYGHARHAFTNPDAGKDEAENTEYNEKADHRSWAAMQTFFKEVFARK